MVAAGMTKRQIEDRLVEVYGENVLLNPRGRTGTSLAAWVLPGTAVLLVAGLLALMLARRRRATGDDEPPPPPELDPADAARIDAELARIGR